MGERPTRRRYRRPFAACRCRWLVHFRRSPNETGASPHFSVGVLQFTNLSGDPSQDYFADGVTENLTIEASRIRNSFVIVHNTAFTYKRK